uniref:Uncharacterized protein n=1 Tax=Vitis vinifera TaxID=29760 RepID=A5BTR6_VITVI|nr:hypothetical protein VITISV_027448 [Vitis vinifera]
MMKAFMDYDTNELVSWWDEMTQMVKAFISDKRYLIVLDDAYRVFCLNEVIEAFQDTMCEEGLVQPEGENEALEDVTEWFLIKLIAQGMVQVTNKKLNGNANSFRLPNALR